MKSEPLRLYGFVGEDVFGDGESITAKGVADALEARAGASSLDVYLSSGGGSVTEGLAVYAQIERFPGNVTIHIDGLAASIASVIALAGNRLVMPPSAMLMIHRPWAVAMVGGNSPQLRERAKAVLKMADDLDVMNETMRGLYASASRLSHVAVQKLMDEETWLTAARAKDLGFADEVSAAAGPTTKAAASVATPRHDFDLLNLYRNTPSGLRSMRAEAAISRLEGLLMRQRVAGFARGASAAAAGTEQNSK